MLVSHRKKFIYTKTNKTGSTSVEAYFERYCMPDGAFTVSHGREETISEAGIIGFRGKGDGNHFEWRHHMPAKVIRDKLGEEIWNSYFKFCVIRNPYDRAISSFYFRCNEVKKKHYSDQHPKIFESWLKENRLGGTARHFSIDGEMCLDYLIRYEHLHEDLEVVCRKLDIPWDPSELPKYKSKSRPAKATAARLYNAVTKAIVEERLQEELELLDYEFPG
jgi:hypothetical protein